MTSFGQREARLSSLNGSAILVVKMAEPFSVDRVWLARLVRCGHLSSTGTHALMGHWA